MENPATAHITDIQRVIEPVMARHSSVVIAILFGSLASAHARFDNDLDLAVSTMTPLTLQGRIDLIEDLAVAFGRPVDLIDLDHLHGPLLHQILTQGQLLLCTNRTRYAELLLRMVYDEADFMPYYRRILADRRKVWIGM